MAVVTFWSDGRGETGKTMSIAAIATQMSLENNCRILIMNTKFNDVAMEDCYWNTINVDTKLNFKEKGKTDIASGTTGLSKAILSGRTSPELVTNYTKVIFKDRLELLTDSNGEEEDYQNLKRVHKDIIKIANQYYDFVFVDLEGDPEDEYVNAILQISNVIVSVMTQSLRTIHKYMGLRKENAMFSELRVMTLIGRYDMHSKYTLKNVARYVGAKTAYGIPYNTLFFESCHEAKVADYFIKFRKAKVTDSNGQLLNSVREFTKDLVELVNMLQMRA